MNLCFIKLLSVATMSHKSLLPWVPWTYTREGKKHLKITLGQRLDPAVHGRIACLFPGGLTRWTYLESGTDNRNHENNRHHRGDDRILPRLLSFWHWPNQVFFQNLQSPLLSRDFWLHVGLLLHAHLWLHWTADCLTLPHITWWDQAMVC